MRQGEGEVQAVPQALQAQGTAVTQDVPPPCHQHRKGNGPACRAGCAQKGKDHISTGTIRLLIEDR